MASFEKRQRREARKIRLLIATGIAAAAAVLLIIMFLRPGQPPVVPDQLVSDHHSVVVVFDGQHTWRKVKALAEQDTWVRTVADLFRARWNLELDRDVMSWAGRCIIALDLTNVFAPSLIAVAAVRDPRTAADTISRIRQGFENKGEKFQENRYEGIGVYAFPSLGTGGQDLFGGGVSFAQVGGCIAVASNEASLRRAIDLLHKRPGLRPLSDLDEWKRTTRAHSARATLLFAADAGALAACLGPMLERSLGITPGAAELQELKESVDLYQGVGWVGAGLDMDGESLRVNLGGIARGGVFLRTLRELASLRFPKQDVAQFIPESALIVMKAGWDPGVFQRLYKQKRTATRGKTPQSSILPIPFNKVFPEGWSFLGRLAPRARGEIAAALIPDRTDPDSLQTGWLLAVPFGNESEASKEWETLRRSQPFPGTRIPTPAGTPTGTPVATIMSGPASPLYVIRLQNCLILSTRLGVLTPVMEGRGSSAVLKSHEANGANGKDPPLGWVSLNPPALADALLPRNPVALLPLLSLRASVEPIKRVEATMHVEQGAFRATIAFQGTIDHVSHFLYKAQAPFTLLIRNLIAPGNPGNRAAAIPSAATMIGSGTYSDNSRILQLPPDLYQLLPQGALPTSRSELPSAVGSTGSTQTGIGIRTAR